MLRPRPAGGGPLPRGILINDNNTITIIIVVSIMCIMYHFATSRRIIIGVRCIMCMIDITIVVVSRITNIGNYDYGYFSCYVY